MDLFRQNVDPREQPLAARMRPRTLEEFIGQEHIVGPGRLLRRAIQADQLSSVIFYGPPGTGKTTLARVCANTTKSVFVSLNAVLSGVKEVRAAVEEAQERRQLHSRRTILFVDEVHRWNKAQQDALLPWVENGTIIMIGATTENPYFEVNKALVSRSRIFQLLPLEPRHLRLIAEQALHDTERGYGSLTVDLDEDALEHLVSVSNGDARSVLNALELAVETTPESFPPAPGERIHVTTAVAEESIQRRAVLYDKEGDYHFDTISAFIKSLRGSDPDAALYWMAKMVYAGEDPAYIFRRMVIFAAEDVGMADPQAIVVAQAAAAAYDRVGLPEGRFHLAEAAIYLATALKSNSAMAFFDALKTVEEERDSEPPVHLKSEARDKEGFGHGEGYLYPHAFRDHWVAQQYLPHALQGRLFYHPGSIGYEKTIRDQVGRRREVQLAAMLDLAQQPQEILSTSPANQARDAWLARAASVHVGHLAEIRDRLADAARLKRHHLALVLDGADGLLAWELLRRVPEGGVWVAVRDAASGELLRMPQALIDGLREPAVLVGDLTGLPDLLAGRGEEKIRFEAVVGRNALALRPDKPAVLASIRAVAAAGGRLALAETIPARSQRLSGLLPEESLPGALRGRLAQAEERMFEPTEAGSMAGGTGDALTARARWNEDGFCALIAAAGFKVVEKELREASAERVIREQDITRWFSRGGKGGETYADLLSPELQEDEISQVRSAVVKKLSGATVPWKSVTLVVVSEAV